MKAKRRLVFTSLITVLVILALIAFYLMAHNGKRPAEADIPPLERPPIKVKVMTLSPDEIAERYLLSGDLKPWKNVRLASDVAGIIEEVLVTEGKRVKKGMPLFRIDVRAMKARLEQARAELTLARRTYERYRPLAESGAISKNQWDKAVADLESSQAAYKMAQIELNRGTVKAPMDGIINSVPVELGEFVHRGDHLADLVQVDRLKAEVAIPERYVAGIRPGTRVTLRVDPYPDKTFIGTITHVSLVADEKTRTFLSKVRVDNKKGLLKSGMIVKAEIVRARVEKAVVVPLSALIDKGGSKIAYIVKDKRAVLRPVTLGIIEGASAQVVDGLYFGDRLVVAGQYMLAPDAPVQIENEQRNNGEKEPPSGVKR
ncbi:MAG: efflux RND transporter periplasmic adaptor subunit [Deltaproteobacteria bacterium]|nr:efflux RND transporter periplasmic adaptor subunit [Deltaproteobacteria bacterium]